MLREMVTLEAKFYDVIKIVHDFYNAAEGGVEFSIGAGIAEVTFTGENKYGLDGTITFVQCGGETKQIFRLVRDDNRVHPLLMHQFKKASIAPLIVIE